MRWVEYFKEILNHPNQAMIYAFSTISPSDQLEVKLDMIKAEGTGNAITALKNSNVTDVDQVTAELFIMVAELTRLLSECWRNECILTT